MMMSVVVMMMMTGHSMSQLMKEAVMMMVSMMVVVRMDYCWWYVPGCSINWWRCSVDWRWGAIAWLAIRRVASISIVGHIFSCKMEMKKCTF